MGIALWVTAAAAAFLAGRLIPLRRRRWTAELGFSLLAALGGGVAATAMDFGGWREPDWRAALFAFFVAMTAIALVRLWPGASDR